MTERSFANIAKRNSRNANTSRALTGASSFFFSSRRRHTRFSRDWSSDVCSSDLEHVVGRLAKAHVEHVVGGAVAAADPIEGGADVRVQIGRASCRERV